MAYPQRYPHPVGCYRTPWGTWFVQVRHNKELFYLGTCDTMEEAEALRDAFREQQRAASAEKAGRSLEQTGGASAVNEIS